MTEIYKTFYYTSSKGLNLDIDNSKDCWKTTVKATFSFCPLTVSSGNCGLSRVLRQPVEEHLWFCRPEGAPLWWTPHQRQTGCHAWRWGSVCQECPGPHSDVAVICLPLGRVAAESWAALSHFYISNPSAELNKHLIFLLAQEGPKPIFHLFLISSL